MDVGNPSNMERMRDLFPDHDLLRDAVSAVSVVDPAIRTRIREDRARFGEIWCPHTAVAAEVWATMPAERRRSDDWCVVSTASPAKFPEIVEPLIEARVPIPEMLARLFDRPSVFEEIDASPEALKGKLKQR
jgi:threonine synthase